VAGTANEHAVTAWDTDLLASRIVNKRLERAERCGGRRTSLVLFLTIFDELLSQRSLRTRVGQHWEESGRSALRATSTGHFPL